MCKRVRSRRINDGGFGWTGDVLRLSFRDESNKASLDHLRR